MHETKQQNVKNGFLLILPPVWRLVKPFALIREVALSSNCSFSFFGGGNGPKGALNGESSSKGELGFQEQFWQRQDTCDYGYEMRDLHHLFIVVEYRF